MNQETRSSLLADSALAPIYQVGSFRSAWKVLKPFWISEEKWKAYGLLSTRLSLDVAQTYLLLRVNDWSRMFGDSIQSKKWDEFINLLTSPNQFPMLAGAFIAAAVASWYVTQSLDLRWGKWLTEKTLNKWLDKGAHNRLPSLYRNTDNPDQRIDEDLRGMASSTLSLGLGFVKTVMRLGSFIPVLWGLSGDFNFQAFGQNCNIPHFMFWAALGYAMAGSSVTYYIGRRLTELNQAQQRLRADFRYALVRHRENASSIAAYKGEKIEKGMLENRFNKSIDSMWKIIGKNKQLLIFQNLYDQVASVFPYIIGAPLYFFGKGTYGTFMQTLSAFGQVQDGMSFFINAFPAMTEWKATSNRVTVFMDAIEKSNKDMDNKTGQGILIKHSSAQRLNVCELSLKTPAPDKRTLLERVNFELKPGQRVHISGASGSGKSTLFKAMNGEWNEGSGLIELPPDKKLMRVPQSSYLPLLPLAGILAYPTDAKEFTEAQLKSALVSVNMQYIAPFMYDFDKQGDYWSRCLSGGEQQKLIVARLSLHNPDYILLDENTSALDQQAELDICEMLNATFPQSGIAHISHRPSIKGFHTHRVIIENRNITFNMI